MAELKRLESSGASAPADRDSQIEALLLDGLDRYFNARYEDAINLWTRVLFLDRSHARARAYIDRARGALAERQRRADEMLQASHAFLDQGQTAAARHLLTEAVAASGDDEQAAALRVRLERLERAHAVARDTRRAPRGPVEAVPGWVWPRRSPAIVAVAAAVVIALVLGIGVISPRVQNLVGFRSDRDRLISSGALKLEVLSSSDVALVRARTLYSRGRLAEALRALDRVSAESPQRSAADELRIEIQQLLLSTGRQLTEPDGSPGSIRR